MPADRDTTDARELEPPAVDLEAVAVLLEAEPGEAVLPLEAGIAGILPRLGAAEERLKRLVQTPQRGLLAGERPAALALRVERPDLLELRGLIAVLDRSLGGVAVGTCS